MVPKDQVIPVSFRSSRTHISHPACTGQGPRTWDKTDKTSLSIGHGTALFTVREPRPKRRSRAALRRAAER